MTEYLLKLSNHWELLLHKYNTLWYSVGIKIAIGHFLNIKGSRVEKKVEDDVPCMFL